MPPRILALLLASALSWSALARDTVVGDMRIGNAWSRPTAEGMSMGVGYLTLTNVGKTADALLSASTPAAGQVEFHETTMVDGIARMRPREQVEVAAGATVKLEPGGLHLMLVGLKAPLAVGSRVPLTLEFRGAGRVTVEMIIGPPPEL